MNHVMIDATICFTSQSGSMGGNKNYRELKSAYLRLFLKDLLMESEVKF